MASTKPKRSAGTRHGACLPVLFCQLGGTPDHESHSARDTGLPSLGTRTWVLYQLQRLHKMFGGPPPKPSPAEQAAAAAQVRSNIQGFLVTAAVLFTRKYAILN